MERQIESFPSPWQTNKVATYLRYFWEYVKWRDFASLKASISHAVFHKTVDKSWESVSAMGRFKIRPKTSDFQYINYAYEFALRDYLKKSVPSITHFVDVGACIGEYVIWLTSLGVKCTAFEPVNYATLEENVRMNGLANQIKVHRCGLGSKQEKVYFEIEPINTGASHIDRSQKQQEPNVEINTFDHVFADLTLKSDEKMVIKLDVEGMEVEVIEGAEAFIGRTDCLEIIYEKLEANSTNVENALLRHGNFVFERLDAHNMIARKVAKI
jgi:FkbM family methyltransferase